MNSKEERGIANGLKAVYVTVALSLAGGGVAWGTLKSQAGENGKAANKNAEQIEKLTDQLNALSSTQARIDERTKRIEGEQREIKGDIKLLLQRLSPTPSVDRLR